MIDYRKDVQKRMSKIKVSVPVVSRKAGIHMQTLYKFLQGSEMKTCTLEAVSNALTEMEKEFERDQK